MDSDLPERRFERARRYARFVRFVVGLHPKLFATAVSGAFVFALCTVASSVAIRWVIDHVVVPRFDEGSVATSTIVTGCALIVGIGLLRAVGVVVRRSFAGMTQWRVAQTLTQRVVDRLMAQPVAWHQRQVDGALVARAGVDVDTAIGVLAPIPFATSTVLMIVVAGVWLVVTDLVMGVVAVSVFPVLIASNILYERSVVVHFNTAQEALGELSGAVHESFEGVQLVKAYGAEARETERLSAIAGRIRDARVRAVHVRGTFEAILEVIPSVANIGLVVLGAARVRSGDVTIGELSGFVYMFTVLVFPLRLIGYALSELPHSYAGYGRIRAVLDEPIEPDPEHAIAAAAAPAAVVLDDVTFTFPDDDEPTLCNATVTIPIGSVTAFVGATGSGKSTLVELISGMLPPDSGRVALAGGPLAIVFQEPFLFSGTIRDNVLVGDASTGIELDDAAVWRALELACADGFVRDLPQRLDTVVGERGITLSGGQRQRIALARALARDPALLVLDDTTSALDPATELAVLDNLRRAMGSTTVVMVATRPSTIALADEVLFVEHGRIVAHGSHDELLRDAPAYRTLVEAFETDRAATDRAATAAGRPGGGAA